MQKIINLSQLMGNQSLNLSSQDLSYSGAYRVCIEETWKPDMLAFAIMNVATIIAIFILHKKGRPDLGDRLINVLFLVNVFALAMNIVIALGFKFLPV